MKNTFAKLSILFDKPLRHCGAEYVDESVGLGNLVVPSERSSELPIANGSLACHTWTTQFSADQHAADDDHHRLCIKGLPTMTHMRKRKPLPTISVMDSFLNDCPLRDTHDRN